MTLDTFNACIEGYEDRLFDMQLTSVHTGFWSGYYTKGKHPRSMKSIITALIRARKKSPQQHADEVDVEEFQRREAEFLRRKAELEKE